MLAFTLTAFLELMDHGIVSWDLISLSFIKQVPLSTKKTIHLTHLSFIETPLDISAQLKISRPACSHTLLST